MSDIDLLRADNPLLVPTPKKQLAIMMNCWRGLKTSVVVLVFAISYILLDTFALYRPNKAEFELLDKCCKTLACVFAGLSVVEMLALSCLIGRLNRTWQFAMIAIFRLMVGGILLGAGVLQCLVTQDAILYIAKATASYWKDKEPQVELNTMIACGERILACFLLMIGALLHFISAMRFCGYDNREQEISSAQTIQQFQIILEQYHQILLGLQPRNLPECASVLDSPRLNARIVEGRQNTGSLRASPKKYPPPPVPPPQYHNNFKNSNKLDGAWSYSAGPLAHGSNA